MFAEVGRYRSFLLRPAPAIAPVAGGPAKIRGKARAGRTSSEYKVRKRDRGHVLLCRVEGSNRGGPALASPDQVTVPR